MKFIDRVNEFKEQRKERKEITDALSLENNKFY